MSSVEARGRAAPMQLDVPEQTHIESILLPSHLARKPAAPPASQTTTTVSATDDLATSAPEPATLSVSSAVDYPGGRERPQRKMVSFRARSSSPGGGNSSGGSGGGSGSGSIGNVRRRRSPTPRRSKVGGDTARTYTTTFSNLPPHGAAHSHPQQHQTSHWIRAVVGYWSPYRTFKVLLLVSAMYAIYLLFETIRSDVQRKIYDSLTEINERIAQCSQEFADNLCHLEHRTPLQLKHCPALEKCMTQDATSFGRSRLAAEAFAEIIEAFMKPLSFRSMVAFVLIAFGTLAVVNILQTVWVRFIGDAQPHSYPLAANHSGNTASGGHYAPLQQAPAPPSYPHSYPGAHYHGGSGGGHSHQPPAHPPPALVVQETWREQHHFNDSSDSDEIEGGGNRQRGRARRIGGQQQGSHNSRSRSRSRSRSLTRTTFHYSH